MAGSFVFVSLAAAVEKCLLPPTPNNNFSVCLAPLGPWGRPQGDAMLCFATCSAVRPPLQC